MMKVPEKCLNCDHTIVQFENVHKGYCKYEMEAVVRCGCSPAQYKAGCVCAEVYCEKRVGG